MGQTVIHMPARRQGRTFAQQVRQEQLARVAPARCGLVGRVAVPVYALERANRCPDCHGEAFFVGRVTAECAGCGLPLAIVDLRRVS
ncbi:hypothetical protein [Sphingopyxis macrogoltabida]|uniref:Uncharacterized protein n=1 Tax=Sphingopyxis macrogoltabida TaxID=33050 RepID=A0AAC8Z274_SPHMC|nr:hypothetical protein [Sphingopyxis macrogoltabida]ALJ14239.1 hypothetical protein LH19_15320 [Sphingopyxis macrogoltabida]AMU90505.1 hypothetical protein ATM17_15895 [Sphingopyxis macrogoltabida]